MRWRDVIDDDSGAGQQAQDLAQFRVSQIVNKDLDVLQGVMRLRLIPNNLVGSVISIIGMLELRGDGRGATAIESD
jgi:hypothetical protein